MPHKVVAPFAFLRSLSGNFPEVQEAKKPQSQRRLSNSQSSSRPTISDRTNSNISVQMMMDRSVKMLAETRRDGVAHKRLSFPRMHSPKTNNRNSLQSHHASLDAVIESPPLVFYGPAASSTGALLSGILKLHINEDFMTVESFKMVLELQVGRKKPFHAHCQECLHQATELTSWNFLQGPATLKRGEHDFPWSFLLPGHLPATMKAALSSIDYVLKAVMVPKTGESLKLSRQLDIKRAIYPSLEPRHSIRIFPPTNLTAKCLLPNVIHPIGESTMTMKMDGIVKRNPDTKSQTQWKLKRLTWRLDETQKQISPACPKHALKTGAGEGAKKGVPHQDTRSIGSAELKSGWKADYSSTDGEIEFEFPFGIRPDANPTCDMKTEDGTEVSHVLVVEMIVAEEFAPLKKPNQITPTGAARVLRMHFNITVTERAGLGISWDEESPPLYENVPVSPPAYANTELYEGAPIPDYDDLLPLDSSSLDNSPAVSLRNIVGSSGSQPSTHSASRPTSSEP
ncbi:hypothetical protein HYFRA_00009340 [Hymenoscyphus fraxineus]|uniref:LDB19 N-terminal domain-containing protein n=1 Tax=Hymenoscyphus fraxineus TaxID=746836 RepID=A0A9N9PKI0_9HELO|nr:hypothetical protein HYFRA_00009340 [Hymenoscyphus fraxineus]